MEIFTCILELAIDYFFLNGVLSVKKNKKFLVCGCFASALVFNIFRSNFMIPFAYNIVITAILWFFLSWICFEGSLIKKVFFTAVGMIMIVVSDMLTSLVCSVVFSTDYDGIEYSMRFVGMIMTNTILFILCIYIVYLTRKKYRQLPLKFNILMILCPMISIFILILVDKSMVVSLAPETFYLLSLLVVFGLAYINLMIFHFFNYYEKAVRVAETDTMLKLNAENYKLLEANEKELHIMRHDILKHMEQIKEIINHGKKEDANKYFQELCQTVKENTCFARTGILSLDTVLNIEGKKAVAAGLQYDLKLNIEAPIMISPVDLTKILYNAIDNAIEASSATENKYILISLSVNEEHLHATIENASPEINIINNTIPSHKKDTTLHGYGLRSMKAAAQKYNGTIQLSYEEGRFVCRILLNNIKPEKNF